MWINTAPEVHYFRCKLTLAPQNRYTTLVWRFLPVAAEPDVRPIIQGLERIPAARKFPPELFSIGAHRPSRTCAGGIMYAVIRTGGKQYRVAPGDVLKIESVASKKQTVEFIDVLAVSGEPGSVAKPDKAKVIAEVLGEGRGDKLLVFHLKRKKQYKKLQGHRQNFTEVRIKAIEADGKTYTVAK